jgi:cytochrome bd-type quinol oxidase subunit 2
VAFLEGADMAARPTFLNAAVAWLFIVGSACFVVGSVPAYVDAVGGVADGVTFVVGSIFFTAASLGQLLQSQTPAMTSGDPSQRETPERLRWWSWLPHDQNWIAAATQFPGTLFFNVSTTAALAHNLTSAQEDRRVWRPDLFGSTLFLVSSAVAIFAVSHVTRDDGEARLPRWIAWLNMLGSVLFMASALASYVLPRSDDELSTRVAVAGTLLGAACFLIGAMLMFPAWRATGTALSQPSPDLP